MINVIGVWESQRLVVAIDQAGVPPLRGPALKNRAQEKTGPGCDRDDGKFRGEKQIHR